MREQDPGNPEQEAVPSESSADIEVEEAAERTRRENEPVRSQRLDIVELKPNNVYRHLYDIEEARTFNHNGDPLVIRRDHSMVNTPGMPVWSMPADTRQEFDYDDSGRLKTERYYSKVGDIEGFVNDERGLKLRGEGRAESDPKTGVITVRYYGADGLPTGSREVRSKDGDVRMLYSGEKLVGKIFEERNADGKPLSRTVLGEDGKVVKVEQFTYEKGKTVVVESDVNGKVKGKTVEELRIDRDLVAEQAERNAILAKAKAEHAAREAAGEFSGDPGEEKHRDHLGGSRTLSDYQRQERGDPTRWGGWFGSGLGF